MGKYEKHTQRKMSNTRDCVRPGRVYGGRNQNSMEKIGLWFKGSQAKN
jgi:hypothetical protein